LETGIVKPSSVRFSPSSFHHFWNRIYAQDFALRPNQSSNAQCRFSRTCCYVEDKLAGRDPCVFNKSLSNRCKHPSNNFSVLFPIGSRFAPLANDFLVLLQRTYLIRNFHFDFLGGLASDSAICFTVGW